MVTAWNLSLSQDVFNFSVDWLWGCKPARAQSERKATFFGHLHRLTDKKTYKIKHGLKIAGKVDANFRRTLWVNVFSFCSKLVSADITDRSWACSLSKTCYTYSALRFNSPRSQSLPRRRSRFLDANVSECVLYIPVLMDLYPAVWKLKWQKPFAERSGRQPIAVFGNCFACNSERPENCNFEHSSCYSLMEVP